MHVWSEGHLNRRLAAGEHLHALVVRAWAAPQGPPPGTADAPGLPADDDLLPALTDSAFALLVARLEEALRGERPAPSARPGDAREPGTFQLPRDPTREAALPSDTLTIVDNRTGREYSLPIVDGAIRATDLAKISAAEGDGGLLSYDPAYLNTSSCRSAITYIDGDAGILRYRGYPIEQVAEQASFLETAYLLLEGELPTARSSSRGKRTSATTPTCTRT